MAFALPPTATTDLAGARRADTGASAPAALQVELSREYRFEAAHQLPKVPPGHRCSRLHGHSYKIEIMFRGPVDEKSGWLIDFYDLDHAVQPLVEALDHHLLNEVEGLENPTCERLCSWVWRRLAPALPQLAAVTIWETVDARCTYRGPAAGASHGR